MAKKSVWLKLEPCGLCCRDELIEYISAPVRLDGSGVAISSNRCDADNKRTVTWSLPSSATSASISARPPYSGNSFGSTCSDAMAAMVSRNWSAMSVRAARNLKRNNSSVYQMMHWRAGASTRPAPRGRLASTACPLPGTEGSWRTGHWWR
ncbi:uncharacterized protein [Zea mays]|uniref:uncharacterized protein n=1 Tax=Zea mays TaxID=4577 RepID=UPI000220CAF0|nr:uncharacterized protein LOC109941620 [Zea mays]|eukprot:XP_020398339.1 uncharacterized protein LOC109941620 [Zea mays]